MLCRNHWVFWQLALSEWVSLYILFTFCVNLFPSNVNLKYPVFYDFLKRDDQLSDFLGDTMTWSKWGNYKHLSFEKMAATLKKLPQVLLTNTLTKNKSWYSQCASSYYKCIYHFSMSHLSKSLILIWLEKSRFHWRHKQGIQKKFVRDKILT